MIETRGEAARSNSVFLGILFWRYQRIIPILVAGIQSAFETTVMHFGVGRQTATGGKIVGVAKQATVRANRQNHRV